MTLSHSPSPSKWQRWLLLLITLLAFGLRLYRLEAQSMWSDEGLSLYRAQLPLAEIFANRIVLDDWPSQDTNPPFYFLLLHLFRAVLGESVFSLRYLGVVAGTLSVLLLYQLGRRLFGYQTAVIAAWLLATSPFHIWQSQEMRNYPLLLLLNLISVYALVRFANGKGWGFGLLFVTAALLAIYTHYFGFFVFAFGLLFLLLANWRRLWRWLLLAGLLSLPLVWVAYGRFASGPQFDFSQVPLLDLLAHGASVYSAGITPGILQPWWRTLPMLLLVGLGLVWGWRSQRQPTMLALGYLVIPFAILVLLSLLNPLYNGPRHLLMGLPPFLLLAAAGWRWPKVGWLLLTAVTLSQLYGVGHQLQLVKDDIQGVATYLSQVVRPGDGVVLHDTVIGFTFDYYYDGPVAWAAFPRFAQMDVATEQQALADYSQDVRRLWFVTEPTPRTYFPTDALTQWADEQYAHLFSRHYDWLWLGVRLDVYVPQPIVAALPEGAMPLALAWQNGLQLRGIGGETAVASGHEWWPDLYWGGPADGDYLVSWRLVDEQGLIWAEVNRPLWPDLPATEWPTDSLIYQPHRVDLPAGVPPGAYQVWLRLLDGATYQPLALQGGGVEALLIPELWLETAVKPSNPLPPHKELAVSWGDLNLVGYSFPDVTYRPGHLLLVDAYWQVERPVAQEYEWVVQLLDPAGQLAAESVATPTRATYPPSQWQRGEQLRGQTFLVVPPLAASGQYRLQMGLRDGGSGAFIRPFWRRSPLVQLGQVTVEGWFLQTDLPEIPAPLDVLVGEPVLAQLAGYGLEATTLAAGDSLSLTLFWQAARETAESYAIFIHVVDAAGNVVAQRDALPAQGVRPTTSWRSGEVLVDGHELALALAAGEYEIWVGLYEPGSGQRPLVIQDGAVRQDGRIFLQTITVE